MLVAIAHVARRRRCCASATHRFADLLDILDFGAQILPYAFLDFLTGHPKAKLLLQCVLHARIAADAFKLRV